MGCTTVVWLQTPILRSYICLIHLPAQLLLLSLQYFSHNFFLAIIYDIGPLVKSNIYPNLTCTEQTGASRVAQRVRQVC